MDGEIWEGNLEYCEETLNLYEPKRFFAAKAKKLGGLVARKNPLYREEFRSIASGVFPAGDIRFQVLRRIKRAASLIT